MLTLGIFFPWPTPNLSCRSLHLRSCTLPSHPLKAFGLGALATRQRKLDTNQRREDKRLIYFNMLSLHRSKIVRTAKNEWLSLAGVRIDEVLKGQVRPPFELSRAVNAWSFDDTVAPKSGEPERAALKAAGSYGLRGTDIKNPLMDYCEFFATEDEAIEHYLREVQSRPVEHRSRLLRCGRRTRRQFVRPGDGERPAGVRRGGISKLPDRDGLTKFSRRLRTCRRPTVTCRRNRQGQKIIPA